MPRKFQKRPPARRPKKFGKKKAAFKRKPKVSRMSYNREIKTVEQSSIPALVTHQSESATQMANGVVIYPAPFHASHHEFTSGTTCDAEVIGCWLTPQYLTSKLVVDWASLTKHEDLNKGLEVRLRYGYITVTPHKANIDLDANWQANVNKMVCRELQSSGIDDNFLVFTKKSRTVQMLGDFMVRPNLRQRAVVYNADNTTTAEARFAPPNNIAIQWDKKKMFSKQKRRVTPLSHAPTKHVLHNSWVPFIYVSADNITANMGDLSIYTSSKFYYTDS